MHALQNYAWPGNVRELMSVIERGVIISTGPDLQLAETLTVSQDMTSPKADGKRLEEVQREFILSILFNSRLYFLNIKSFRLRAYAD